MKQEVDIEIDVLSESVVEVSTGKVFKTQVLKANTQFINTIHKKNGWKFNWKKEAKEQNRIVFKMVLDMNKSVLLGMLCIELKTDHFHIHLAEKSPNQFGKSNKYEGIGGNLFAFACKYSLENGFEGVVAFIAKTKLIEHYSVTLGAVLLKNQRMFILKEQAEFLIKKYFYNEEK